VAGMNVLGVRESSWMNVVFTLIEAGGLVAVVVAGLRDPDLGAALGARPDAGTLAGASLLVFAFLGFEEIANLAEESKRPERDLPRAILLAIGLSTVLYVFVALASLALVGPERLANSDSPLADAMRAGAPRLAGAVGGIALFATANTALIAILAASRMLLGMARGGDAPRGLTRIVEKRGTPARAILVVLAGALLLIPFGRVELLASVASLAALLAFMAMNLAVLWLRRIRPEMHRPFRVPGAVGRVPVIPVLGLLVSLALVIRFEPMAYVVVAGVAGAALLVMGRRRPL
jgi:APA family basic amino acid/polyamine antiporter